MSLLGPITNFLYFSKEITAENTYDGVFGINYSQTGSTSNRFRTSPLEQLTLQHVAGANSIVPQPTCKATDVLSSNKVESEQIFTEQADNAGKKVIKGFGEAALTKVGHWSKNAFNFFRTKNASSG